MSTPGSFPEFLRATIAKAQLVPGSQREVMRALARHTSSMKRIGGFALDAVQLEELIEIARTLLIATLETICDTEQPASAVPPLLPEPPPSADLDMPDVPPDLPEIPETH